MSYCMSILLADRDALEKRNAATMRAAQSAYDAASPPEEDEDSPGALLALVKTEIDCLSWKLDDMAENDTMTLRERARVNVDDAIELLKMLREVL
jgi:hypothetical protein